MEDIGTSRRARPEIIIDEFLEETYFLPAIKKWTPDLLDEVKGISEASGVTYKTIFAFQLWDEYWWYSRNKAAGFPIPERQHCTIGGVFNQKGLPSILGTNMDLPGWTDGFGVILDIRYPKSSLRSHIFTAAGYLGACGLNNRAVGQSANTVLQLNCHPGGLPCVYIIRGILEKTDFTNAVRFLHEVRHASGQNYFIGGPDEVASFECSANKVSRYIPYPGANVVYHTNHPLVNDDRGDYEAISKKSSNIEERTPSNSEIRLQAMEKRLKNSKGLITVDTFKDALASQDDPANSVCHMKPEKGKGNGQRCLIYEFSEPPVLHFAPGPSCTTKFKIFTFD
jgi:hypothetical protein